MMKLALLLIGVLTPSILDGQPPAPAQVRLIKDLKPKEIVYRDASRTKPVVITNKKAAGKYFAKEELAKLLKTVDLKEQVVFIFAWRGSGQDRMEYTIMKSLPIQVEFEYQPGRTRDLRPHTKVYAINHQVKWKGKPVRDAAKPPEPK